MSLFIQEKLKVIVKFDCLRPLLASVLLGVVLTHLQTSKVSELLFTETLAPLMIS